jgi:hypothetical protein
MPLGAVLRALSSRGCWSFRAQRGTLTVPEERFVILSDESCHPEASAAVVILRRQPKDRDRPGRGLLCRDDLRAGIQNGGAVLHERHERACFSSRSTGTSPLTTSRNEQRGLRLGTPPSRRAVPFSFRSLREEPSAGSMDAQHFSHAAHVKRLQQLPRSGCRTTCADPPDSAPSTGTIAIPRFARDDDIRCVRNGS